LTRPGQLAADTKEYLYVDPGKLTAGAASMWDPNTPLGTVTLRGRVTGCQERSTDGRMGDGVEGQPGLLVSEGQRRQRRSATISRPNRSISG
jgi:hypothetical protein